MNNINQYTNSNKCCGCGACSNVCPKNAITMNEDDKGFLYPLVDKEKCVDCGLCLKVCVFNQNQQENNNCEITAYAIKNKNIDVRLESRSGGIFTALTDRCLDNEGVIYGVALNEKFEALHKRACTKAERDEFRGSKYIQSVLGDAYKNVKEDLKNGKEVIFSGTPCQVNAMKKYLIGIDTSKLLLIDIVCHGVPSQKVWLDYLDDYKKKKKGNITKVDFRNKKKYGWAASKETIFVDGKAYDDDMFFVLFNRGITERESCFICPYKTMNRTGDITIGDFWGIDNVNKGFNDNKGVSLVICNTEKGKQYLAEVDDKIDALEVGLEECLQPALMKNSEYPEERDRFWKAYSKYGKIKVARYFQYRVKLKAKFNRIIR